MLSDEERDELLRAKLGVRLVEEEPYITGEFKYDVEDGVAQLYGAVDSFVDKDWLEQAALTVEGINSV